MTLEGYLKIYIKNPLLGIKIDKFSLKFKKTYMTKDTT